MPGGATVVFSAHGVSRGGARRGRGARPARVRRDVPAGHQGARRGREDARAGPRDRDDRPRAAIRRSRARWASATAACTSSSRSADVARLAVRDPEQLAYVTQTTLSVDDAAAIVAALKRALSRDRRAEEGRHLLRDAEPPGRGQGSWRRRSTWSSSSAARTARTRIACAKSRRHRGVPSYMVDHAERAATRMDRRQAPRRRDRRRIGAGSARDAGDRTAQGIGRARRRICRRRRERTLPDQAVGGHAAAKAPVVRSDAKG